MTTVSENATERAEALEAAISIADRRTLAAVVAYLTGEPGIVGDARDRAGVEAAARRVLPPFVGRSLAEIGTRDDAVLGAAMSLAAGEQVSSEYADLARRYFGLDPADPPSPLRAPDDFLVVVIGAGITGVLMGLHLQNLGFDHFVILDRNPEPGGVWWQNRYPGCRVDTPSLIYSYSFNPDPGWPEHFARQRDLFQYVTTHAARLGERVRSGVDVRSLRWDEQGSFWRVTCRLADGTEETIQANVVVGATGILQIPKLPDVEGIAAFEGPAFHSSRWDPAVNVEGKRVAVLGSGASANQIVPAIAGRAAALFAYQRTPHWMMAHPQYGQEIDGSERYLLKHLPSYCAWFRFRQFWALGDSTLASIRIDPSWPYKDRSANEVNDRLRQRLAAYIASKLAAKPDIIAAVTPTYPPFTKRMLLDNGWYEALARPDVHLVTSPIVRIRPNGIETVAGHEDVDVIIFATGFHTDRYLGDIQIIGRGEVDVRKGLDTAPKAYMGLCLEDAPNLFLTWGPYSVPGHGGTGMFISETQVSYIGECLRLLLDSGARSMQVRRTAVQEYVGAITDELRHYVWSDPRTNSWYKRPDGDVVLLPRRLIDMWNDSQAPDPSAFDLD